MLLVPETTRKRLIAERASEIALGAEVQVRLKEARLRPTRQRLAIGRLLFGPSHRHVTVDDLFQEALAAGEQLSLATIYNTLHHFTDAGLVRRICTGSERVYFDTDTGDHHHFYIEAESRVIDVPDGKANLDRLPSPPAGYEVTKVDVVIHLKAKDLSTTDNKTQGQCRHPGGCERYANGACQTVVTSMQTGDLR